MRLHHPWAQNLHQFWDTAGQPPTLTVDQLQSLCEPSDLSQSLLAGPSDWLEESYQLARQVAYPGGNPPGPELSQEYQRQVRQVCLGRLALAGWRLADLLESQASQAEGHLHDH